jgi:hypothetical protein
MAEYTESRYRLQYEKNLASRRSPEIYDAAINDTTMTVTEAQTRYWSLRMKMKARLDASVPYAESLDDKSLLAHIYYHIGKLQIQPWEVNTCATALNRDANSAEQHLTDPEQRKFEEITNMNAMKLARALSSPFEVTKPQSRPRTTTGTSLRFPPSAPWNLPVRRRWMMLLR